MTRPYGTAPLADGRMAYERFTRDAMIGYGFAAYCAGWSAAVRCIAKPQSAPENHGRDWFFDNPPVEMSKPVWRIPHASEPAQ